jgi:hypothetical protein
MRWRCHALLLIVSIMTSVAAQPAFAEWHGRGAGIVLVQRFDPPGDRDRGGPRGGGFGFRRFFAPRSEGNINRFWGGPYWGYGARFGHPCRWCRSNCTDNGGGDERCRRCISRCGW